MVAHDWTPYNGPLNARQNNILTYLNKVTNASISVTKTINKEVVSFTWDSTYQPILSLTYPVVENKKNFLNAIIDWNIEADGIYTQLHEDNPEWLVDGIPSQNILGVVNFALGEDYVFPPTLNGMDLVNALATGNLKDFDAFTADLKTHIVAVKKYIESTSTFSPNPLVTIGAYNWLYTAKLNLYDNMRILQGQLQPLWDKFGSKVQQATDQAVVQGNIDKFLKNNPSVKQLGDGSLLITDLNTVVTPAVAKSATQIYFVPQADDVNGALQSMGRFNPPPHVATKQVSPMAFPSVFNNSSKSASTLNRNVSSNPLTNQITFANRLGFMYQDSRNPNKATADRGISRKIAELWGFQFTYNPAGLSYVIASDPSIDWESYGGAEGDVANILFGQGTYEFTIMLNRQVDMTALRAVRNSGDYASTAKSYPRALTKEEVNSILTRGTEYDLEFLYRVLNGDPQESPVMKNGYRTADFGLLMGMPIWLRIHDNMRIKGIVSSIQVNHIQFNADMIPMLTEVRFSFARIPVITYNEDYSNKVYDKLKSITGNSGSTN